MKHILRHAPPMARLLALAVAGMTLCASQQALAAGTASSTAINNTASLSFSVGGVPQTAVPSNTTTFVVDNKINLTVVTTNSAAVPATPGQVAATPLPVPPAYLSFTVTNTGNTTQDYLLTNTNPASGVVIPFGGNSEFAVSGCRTFVENGTSLGLQIGTDLEVAYLDDVTPDATKTVYLVCNTPLTATDSQDAAVGLIAEAVAAGGSSSSPSASYTAGDLTAANTVGGVEIVAADGFGTEADLARDAKQSARSAYVIASATLSVTKAVALLCDPFNGIASVRKNIPGAIVQWTLTVSNTGSVPALLSTITDTLNPNTTQDPNLVIPADAATCSSTAGTPASLAGRGFRIVSSVGTRPLGGASATGYMTGAADSDGATLSVQVVTINYAQALPAGTDGTTTWGAGELKNGETATVTFNVTIN